MVQGSNPGGGEIFRTCPNRPWGPPSLLYNGYRVFPGVKERPGRDTDPSPPSSAVGHERVELYLYSPYGPYGLYRASVPVQGCTLKDLWLAASCQRALTSESRTLVRSSRPRKMAVTFASRLQSSGNFRGKIFMRLVNRRK